VAIEKNIEAFLSCEYPGTKVVVGDGPARASLEARFPEARFMGKRTGLELAGFYAGADIFVFPSKTDTFGLVMIEALACGTPVAAYPVAGPVDIVTEQVGALSDDLARAIDAARYCERAQCAAIGAQYSWEAATRQFLSGLVALEEEESVLLRSAPAI
jgi:glycosyltransferase involved in cell wall biosynthesis